MKTTVAPSNLYITVLIGVGAYSNPSKLQKDSIYKSWDMPFSISGSTFEHYITIKNISPILIIQPIPKTIFLTIIIIFVM